MALVSLMVHAYDFKVNGIYYNIISVEDLTCSVTSECNDYVCQYSGVYSGNIVIPSEVTVEEQTYSVVSIDSDAFSGCESLISVDIPDSVTEIGSGIFIGCLNLSSVTLPNSITNIPDYMFYGCKSLKFTIPDSITEIGYASFAECENFVSVIIPNSVEVIGKDAFKRCIYLKSITIPTSVKEIGEYAFLDCKRLKSITIPNSVTKLKDGTFDGCASLESVILPPSVIEIITYDAHAYSSMPPEFFEGPTFLGCSKLNKLVILGDEDASNLMLKGQNDGIIYPFAYLSLEELYLGKKVENEKELEIEFKNSLRKITFGEYLDEVGTGVYGDLASIPTTAEIYCENPIPPTFGNYFTPQQYKSNVIYVPTESLDAYKQAEGWKNFWNINTYNPISGNLEVYAEVSAGIYKVYNLAGGLVKETMDKEAAYNLPKGFYIINGQKVAIK